jgi:hypothetical protein
VTHGLSWVPVALHLEVVEDGVDVGKFFAAESDVCCRDVLLDSLYVGGAGDGDGLGASVASLLEEGGRRKERITRFPSNKQAATSRGCTGEDTTLT